MAGMSEPSRPIDYDDTNGALHVMPPKTRIDRHIDRVAQKAIRTELTPTVHKTWSLSQLNAMSPEQTRLVYYAAALDEAFTERDADTSTGAARHTRDTYMLNVLAAVAYHLKQDTPHHRAAPRPLEQGDTDADREVEMDTKQQALDDADRVIAEHQASRNKITATAETSTKYRRAQDIAAAAMRYRDTIQQLDMFQQDHADTNTPHIAARRRQLRNQVEQAQQILNDYSIAEPAPTEPDPAGEPTRAERDRMLTRMGFTAPFSDVTVVHMSSHVVGVRRRTVTNGRTLDTEETVRFTDPRPRRLP